LYFVDPEEALTKFKMNKKGDKWRFNVNEAKNGERDDNIQLEKSSTCGVSCDCMGDAKEEKKET